MSVAYFSPLGNKQKRPDGAKKSYNEEFLSGKTEVSDEGEADIKGDVSRRKREHELPIGIAGESESDNNGVVGKGHKCAVKK